jgi:hypothetical protein
MRQVTLVTFCLLFPFSSPEASSQELKPACAEAARDEQLFDEKDTLRAFQPPPQGEVAKARSLIMGLLVGSFAAVIIMFILIAYFYEPSEASKPYRPTSVDRPEGFTPWRPKQETKQERFIIDDKE